MYVALLTQSAKDTIHGGTGTVACVAWLQWGDNTVASRKQHIFGSVDARLKAIYRAIDTSDYVPLNRFTHERVAGQGAGDSFRNSTESRTKLSQPGKFMFTSFSNEERSDALTATRTGLVLLRGKLLLPSQPVRFFMPSTSRSLANTEGLRSLIYQRP